VLLGLIDVLTFCLRRTYSDRFNDFQRCAEANDIFDVHEWRKAQQDEWDRLSTLLALLATMNAAIFMKVDPSSSPFPSSSLWLGAAGLSVSGCFLIQYYSIKTFPITDEQLRRLVLHAYHRHHEGDTGELCVWKHRQIVSIALSAPPLFGLWASMLFLIGIYGMVVRTTDFGQGAASAVRKMWALVPLSIGALTIIIALVSGEIAGYRMSQERKRSREANHRRWCKPTPGAYPRATAIEKPTTDGTEAKNAISYINGVQLVE